jgi:hypothetical protein
MQYSGRTIGPELVTLSSARTTRRGRLMVVSDDSLKRYSQFESGRSGLHQCTATKRAGTSYAVIGLF